MVYDGVLEGRYVDLKACTEDEAEFTLALRTDPKLGKYFPKVNNTVEQQQAWIRSQREKPGDYFFVVWNKAGERIGTIGCYNIVGDEGEGGRLIIRTENVFEVFEAQLMLSSLAFDSLGLQVMRAFIYEENKQAIRFNKMVSGRMSEPVMDADGRMVIRVETTREEFNTIRRRLSSVIYRE